MARFDAKHKVWVCEWCNRVFSTVSAANAHEQIHDDDDDGNDAA